MTLKKTPIQKIDTLNKNQINEANIYLALNPPLADGRCKLMLDFSFSGERLRMYTGESCLPEHFDKNKKRVNRKHPFQIETNIILDNYCRNVVAEYKRYKATGVIPTKQQLKQAIKPKKKEDTEGQNMGYYFDLINRQKIIEGRAKNTRSTYITLRNRLALYEKHRKIKLSFETFDAIRHTDFMEFLIYDIENHPNTIAKRNQTLKHFFSFCERIHNVKVHPFYKEIQSKKVETQTIFLEERELEAIENLQTDLHLEHTKDCYLFSCYTGRRYSEVKNLTYDQLSVNEDGLQIMTFYEDKKQYKKKLTIALNDNALAIIDKYRANQMFNNRSYVLPMLSNVLMNRHLKELFNLANINSPVEKIIYQEGMPIRIVVPKYELATFHTARHTYATLSVKRGMRVEVLQKELNHSTINQTMHYVKIIESQQHQEALKTWNKPKQEEVQQPSLITHPSQELERVKEKIMNANKENKTCLELNYELDKEVINNLTSKGFVIKVPSPIQKLEGIFHIISW